MARSRQLAAIMFTDIQGYTAIMQSDEEKAVAFRDQHRAIFEEHTKNFNGRIIQYYGDGTLSIFHSAVEATHCAIEMQKEFLANNVPVRIGLHVGDIILAEEDIIGDGVNLASRVESLAVAGSVLVTDKVISEIRNQTNIETKLLGRFQFKNDHKPRDVYAVVSEHLVVPDASSVSGKTEQIPSDSRGSRPFRGKKILWIVGSVVAGVLLFWSSQTLFTKQDKKNWTPQTALSEIQRLMDVRSERWSGHENWEAFKIAWEIKEQVPGDTTLRHLWPQFSHTIDVHSSLDGAQVYVKKYSEPDSSWLLLGMTPLEQVRAPYSILKVKLEKEGYSPVEDLWRNWDRKKFYKLPEEGTLPDGMALVVPNIDTGLLNYLGFLGKFPSQDFYFDRHEVTNRSYKDFIDAGGYAEEKYWRYPFTINGANLSWDEVMSFFVDKTGRPGPATWEGSNYPAGQEDHPVGGVSWYEAAAYAEFAGKRLPSWSHHRFMTAMWAVTEVLPLSNFNGTGSVPVGTFEGTSVLGVSDMLGNVGEWCFNASTSGTRFILGGGWDNPNYVALQDDLALDPMDRSSSNGFRCMRYVTENQKDSLLYEPIETYRRDYYNELPVSDEVFSVFLNQYVYDKTPFNENVEYEKEEDEWIKQKVTIDAPYGDEKIPMYLFLPKRSTPPYQTVVYWPGSNAKVGNQSDVRLQDLGVIDFIIRSGRAVLYPVYKGSYEREFEDEPSEGIVRTFASKGVPVFRNCRDLKICWKEERTYQLKDLQRCIDYLETRKDIDMDKLAFQGRSWGGRLAPMVLTVETRFKAGIILLGGFSGLDLFPESDPFHYAPRVKVPILMLGGEYDNIRPLETLQKPFFDLLGTPDEDKVLKTFKTAHSLPRAGLIQEVLDWLDQIFGKVE